MNFIIEKTEPYNESFIYNIEEKFKIKIPKTLKKYYLKYGDSEIRNCKIKINSNFYLFYMVDFRFVVENVCRMF